MERLATKLLLAESFWSFGSGLFLPIFAIFSSQIGGDITDAGIAAAIFILVTSLIEYPVGKLLDKYKEKWFIVADYFLEAVIFIGYMFITTKYQLFILQIFLGVANAIGDPSWESMYDKCTPAKRSGSSWANSHLFIGIFNAFGIIVGVSLVDIYGFKSVFALGAIFSFIAGLISIKYIKNK